MSKQGNRALRRTNRYLIETLDTRRLLAGSTLDPTFGAGGTSVAAPLGNTVEVGTVLLRQSDGKVLMTGAGETLNYGLLARFNSDGSPDTTFGTGGSKLYDAIGGNSLTAVKQLSGGGYEAVARGVPSGGASIMRLLSNGQIDTSYGTNGMVQLQDWPAPDYYVNDIVRDNAGRLVVAVRSLSTDSNIRGRVSLVRWNLDGTRDATFGTGGQLIDTTTSNLQAWRLLAQPSGRILVVAKADSITTQPFDFVLLAFNDNGTRNQSLGSTWLTQVDFPSRRVEPRGLFVNSAGAVVVAGLTLNDLNAAVAPVAVAKFTTLGGLDPTFGGGTGMVTQSMLTTGQTVEPGLQSFAMDSADRILAIGSNQQVLADQRVTVARITATGTLDTTFDSDGVIVVPNPTGTLQRSGFGIIADASNKPVLATYEIARSAMENARDAGVQRLTTSGGADTTWNATGAPTVIALAGNIRTDAISATTLADGSVVTLARADGQTAFALTHTLANGMPDTSWGSNAGTRFIHVKDWDEAYPNRVIPRQGGGVLITGLIFQNLPAYAPTQLFVVATTAAGLPDPAFGVNGVALVAGTVAHVGMSLVQQPDGRVVVLERYNGSASCRVGRFTAQGTLDTAFGTAGWYDVPNVANATWSTTLLMQADGRIVLAGSTSDGQLRAIRLTVNGALDTAYGVSGIATCPLTTGIGSVSSNDAALTADGSLLYWQQYSSSGWYRQQFFRFTPSGAIDSAFGIGGATTPSLATADNFNRFTRSAVDGRIVLVGRRTTGSGATYNSTVVVRRFLPNGNLDSGFGTAGRTEYDIVPANADDTDTPAAVVVDSAGRIVISGTTGPTFTSDLFVTRFLPDAGTAPVVLSSQFRRNDAQPAVEVTFDQDVSFTLDVNDLTLQNLTTGQTVPNTALALTFDATTGKARITFPGLPNHAPPDGNLKLTINPAGVKSAAPYSIAMSAAYVTNFRALAGDANDDGVVNFSDLLILAANYGKTDMTFAQADFSYDGTVNFNDLLLLAAAYGKQVTPPAPPRVGMQGNANETPLERVASEVLT
ncbi:MAG: hypothetical protein QM770_24885 [Tepidisphaeraceae bacterium]